MGNPDELPLLVVATHIPWTDLAHSLDVSVQRRYSPQFTSKIFGPRCSFRANSLDEMSARNTIETARNNP